MFYPAKLSDDLFRPISNLSFISKMVERMVDSRLIAYTDRYALTPIYQSAYRRNHSTETALVRLYNDMIHVVDRGEVGALVLLDISAAFDTVDHWIMADVLHRRFDIRGRCAGLVCLLLRRQNPGGHRWPPHITGILVIDRGLTGFGVGAKVICHLRRQCARHFRIPAGYVPPVRR